MHGKAYASLLRLYPRKWRREFGAEMSAVFADALADARRRGPRAVIALWLRELAAAQLDPLLALVLLLGSGWGASHLVAYEGLFHATSLALLGAGIAAAGFLFGSGRGLVAALVLVAAFGTAYAGDRLALRIAAPGSLTIPGVRLDVVRDEGPMPQRMKARMHTETFERDGAPYLTVVHAGGVDGAYALLAMLMLATTAMAGRRAAEVLA
jgi:hypothetical protein